MIDVGFQVPVVILPVAFSDFGVAIAVDLVLVAVVLLVIVVTEVGVDAVATVAVVATAVAREFLPHSLFPANYLGPRLGLSWSASLPFLFPLTEFGLLVYG